MSSPTGVSDETRSQDSVHASSQYAAGTALADTASSAHHIGRLPGSSSTISGRAPNIAYSWGMAAARARSASPGPRRSPSPLGVSVVHNGVQLVEQSTATAISGVGRVEEETRCVRQMVEATMAKARSMRGGVESRVTTLAAAADASTASIAEEISSRVREAVEYSDAQASRATVDIMQRLEKEIVAAARSTAVTAEIHMRTVIEGVRRDIQAQLEQTRTDSLRREQEAQHRIEDISKQSQTLTMQLNKFQPASEQAVGVSQGKLSEQVQQQFDAQQDRIQKLSDAVLESRKDT